MAWVKVDDHFPEHPKVLDVGPLAEALWLRALCYANRYRTDGVIPAGFVRRMPDLDGSAEAERLVSAGLWDQSETGYIIHDYLEHQQSSGQIEAISAVRAEAGRRGGLRRSEVMEANNKQVATPLLQEVASKPQANDKQKENKKENKKENGDLTTAVEPPLKREAVPPSSAPYRLFQVLCDETGDDEAAATAAYKKQQTGIAKQLLSNGVTETEVAGCVRYLKSQTWRTTGIDLRTVASEIGKWQLAGKPDQARASPGVNGRPSQLDHNAEFLRRVGATPAIDQDAIETTGRPR